VEIIQKIKQLRNQARVSIFFWGGGGGGLLEASQVLNLDD